MDAPSRQTSILRDWQTVALAGVSMLAVEATGVLRRRMARQVVIARDGTPYYADTGERAY